MHRPARGEAVGQRLFCISNCGLPEAHHNDVALAICRRFAHTAGFAWSGGLALGAGEIIRGQQLSRMGGLVRNVTRSLDLAADALAEGKLVPREAMTLMAKPLLPAWLYVRLGALNWRQKARQHGVRKRLANCPYC
jgi:hypothetical protein